MKHHDQKQVGEERAYLAYTSISLFIIEGGQDRNSNMAGTWRQKLKGLLLVACSACFLTEPRTTSPELAPPTIEEPFPHQLLGKKMFYSLILWRHFLN